MTLRYPIRLEDDPPQEDRDAFGGILESYNTPLAGPPGSRKLYLYVRDDEGRVRGGLHGSTYWGWLHVSLLAVEESLRGQGYGSELLRRAEEEAVVRGCRGVYLDTFTFQARPFYERNGYELFGTLDEFPPGHKLYFMKKVLTPAAEPDPE